MHIIESDMYVYIYAILKECVNALSFQITMQTRGLAGAVTNVTVSLEATNHSPSATPRLDSATVTVGSQASPVGPATRAYPAIGGSTPHKDRKLYHLLFCRGRKIGRTLVV